MKRVTAEQMKALDRAAIEEYGIPAIVLMENAGSGAAAIVDEFAERRGLRGLRGLRGRGTKIAVVCGRGNNGGDGFVVARHLHNRGWQVEILYDGDPEKTANLTDETRTNLLIVQKMAIPIFGCDEIDSRLAGASLIVDALLGIGLQGEVRPRGRAIVKAINACGAPAIALDVPSGLDCDSGLPLGCTVRAEATVTFGLPKVGFFLNEGPESVGTLHVVAIGIPVERIESLP